MKIDKTTFEMGGGRFKAPSRRIGTLRPAIYGGRTIKAAFFSVLSVCVVALSFDALAATWNITDNRELTEADQAELNTIESITISGGTCLSVAAGNTVTISCPISSTGAPVLGKSNTGTLIIANAINSSVTKNTDLPCYGAVTFAEGASIGNAHLNIATGDNSPSSIVTFNTVFPTGGGPARFQTRGNTSFTFGRANVFANTSPTAIIGRGSNPAGILDLNGYDQSIPTIAFTAPTSQSYLGRYATNNYFTSDTAATLTVTKGFSTASGYTGIFDGRLLGGLSFKLASTTGGTASFSNVFALVSSTTGSLICAAGTIRLLNGARFDSLTSIRKEGSGNFEISTPVINTTVDLYLDGTGKITLNSDVTVAHAYTNDTNGGWAILKATEYDATTLGDHLAGSGKVTVLYDDTAVGDATYTWTGALGNGTLSDGGNWEGGEAPTLDSVGETLVFPATGTSSCRVDGTITVGGIEIAYPGAFTVQAGTDAQILLGDGGLSVADTTEQTNTVTLAAPISLLPGIPDVTFAVADGTALNIEGGISAPAANGRRLVIDGGTLTLGGDSTGMLLEMAITNVTSVPVTSESGLGAGGAKIYGELVPYFDGTRRCTSPWSVIGPFRSDPMYRYLYPAIAGSPFEFTGAVGFTGTCQVDESNGTRYTGFLNLSIRNDTIFRGGLAVDKLSRIELDYGNGSNTVYILDHPVVRGTKSPSDSVDVRFYGVSATNSFAVTDQSLDSAASGVFVSKCSLVCIADNCIGGRFRAYVNSRDPGNGDPIWSKFDLNGHDQTIRRIIAESAIAEAKYPVYPNSYVEVASETPATLTLGESDTSGDMHQMKFTGAVSFRTAAPWAGFFYITNTVSTTTGDLEVTSGLVAFRKDAGWGGGTNVTVSGTGELRMSEGTKGFSPIGGGASKVNLKLAGGGTLNITNAATVVSVRTCETNGVRLSRGDYTAATLPGFLTGAGTLHVRMMYGNGTSICIR